MTRKSGEPVARVGVRGSVVILRGLPGVGKTTSAALLRDRLAPAVRISVDTIRYLAAPRGLDAESIRRAEGGAIALAAAYALTGSNAVIEGVFLGDQDLESMVGILESYGLDVVVITLEASVEHLLRRNRERVEFNHVDPDRIRDLHQRFDFEVGNRLSSDDLVPEEVVDNAENLVEAVAGTRTQSNESYLFLMRHGAALVDASVYPDHYSMPLSREGRRQVLSARTVLPLLGITRLVASPFRRCVESAELLSEALDLPVELDERLRERSFPEFFGKPYSDIALKIGLESAERLKLESYLVEVSGAETLADASERVLQAVRDLRDHQGARTLVVAHGGVHGFICADLLGLKGANMGRRFALDHARLSCFEVRGRGKPLGLVAINTTAESLLLRCGE